MRVKLIAVGCMANASQEKNRVLVQSTGMVLNAQLLGHRDKQCALGPKLVAAHAIDVTNVSRP